MGDIYHSSLLIGASEDIYVRTKGAKLVAKVMKSAGEKTFIQEVSIMSMFNQHKNVYQTLFSIYKNSLHN